MHLVRDSEKCNLHRKVWYEGGFQLSYIGTRNVRKDELNPRLWYAMLRLDNRQNTCKIGVTGDRRFLRTRCSDD